MNLKQSQRENCRICGSTAVKPFLDFPQYPLSDNHLRDLSKDTEFLSRYRAFWCSECRTAQNLTDFDWSGYYTNYDYTVSQSGFARQFMDRLAENTIRKYGLPEGSSIVEIGSSDGYQLACFKKRGMKVFGYEPGKMLADAAEKIGVRTSTSLFNDDTVGEIPADMRPVQAFVSLYTFDHVPDPLACLRTMRRVLDPQRGVVIIEVHDLERIVERREACLFCHEHTVYLSQASMARMMARAGLKLVSVNLVEERERRGNSLLAVGAADTSPIQPDVPPLSPLTASLDSDWNAYEAFSSAVDQSHQFLGDYVRERVAQRKKVAGYGASARAISTLSLAGLTREHLCCVCDSNKNLHGAYLPQSRIQIVPLEKLLASDADEVIVFAYGYMREIRAALEPFVQRGGKVLSLLDLLAGNPRAID